LESLILDLKIIFFKKGLRGRKSELPRSKGHVRLEKSCPDVPEILF
jgi:hypothetical protein